MRSITLRNYRCFGDEPQQARVAPLTLLVGENSSGKTSLMAMVRAMWDVVYDERIPDFKEEPYDLGSFDEIAHRPRARGTGANSFEVTVELEPLRRPANGAISKIHRYQVEFSEKWSAPVPVRRRIQAAGQQAGGTSDYWFEHRARDGESEALSLRTPAGEWRGELTEPQPRIASPVTQDPLVPLEMLRMRLRAELREGRSSRWTIHPVGNAPELTDGIVTELEQALPLRRRIGRPVQDSHRLRPFASAPVRSQPRRTYDPVRITADSVGDAIPTYLAQLETRAPDEWHALKTQLEEFGRSAELFDELKIRRHGKHESDPFQIQVRKLGDRATGRFRNLVDMGYGVSQVLPVITELLRPGGAQTLLLQQPEVHLHPVAQASLGSLMCQLVSVEAGRRRRQIIVETHSDFIIDRVRMAVADGSGGLSPDDVSIVYFERCGLDVRLHSISVDRLGNIEGAPAGYRQFFMDELQRSLGG